MKRVIWSVALFTVLSVTAVSCQKEDPVFQTSLDETVAVYTVHYSIDGVHYTQTIAGEQAWDDFLHWIVAMAREGHSVTFKKEDNARSISGKEVVSYTTYDEKDAINWCNEMSTSGYTVSISYDEKTGIYTCTAIK